MSLKVSTNIGVPGCVCLFTAKGIKGLLFVPVNLDAIMNVAYISSIMEYKYEDHIFLFPIFSHITII